MPPCSAASVRRRNSSSLRPVLSVMKYRLVSRCFNGDLLPIQITFDDRAVHGGQCVQQPHHEAAGAALRLRQLTADTQHGSGSGGTVHVGRHGEACRRQRAQHTAGAGDTGEPGRAVLTVDEARAVGDNVHPAAGKEHRAVAVRQRSMDGVSSAPSASTPEAR